MILSERYLRNFQRAMRTHTNVRVNRHFNSLDRYDASDRAQTFTDEQDRRLRPIENVSWHFDTTQRESLKTLYPSD